MRCDLCGKPMRRSDAGRCRTCGFEGLCPRCLKQITGNGCPDTMRDICPNYTRYVEDAEPADRE